MTRIRELQVILQKPADPEDYGIDEADVSEHVFATEGQTEVKKLVQVGLDKWNENTLDRIEVNLPVGVSGMSDLIRRAVIRHIFHRKSWDNAWEYFYVIAEFERPDGTTFFRTVIPRTAISIQFRNLRRGVKRNRLHGVQHRRVLRRK